MPNRKEICLTLPHPPSVNHYWRHVGNRVLISREGRAYREDVRAVVLAKYFTAWGQVLVTGRLRVSVDWYPPDKRRRDIDNIGKALFDAMGHAGIYEDDSQIDE